MNQPSLTVVNRPVLTNNATSSNAADYEFPGDTYATARQVQMLVYTNSSLATDSFNGNLGTIQGGIYINDPQFYSTGTDTQPWHFDAYTGVSGTKDGFTIDTEVNRPRIWRASGFSAQGDIVWDSLGGANDVTFNDVREFNHSTNLFEEVATANTSNKTLTNSEMDKVQTNEGAAGTIRFTLPAAQGSDYNRQKFTFEVTDAQTLEIIGTGNDDIAYSGGNRMPDAGTPEFVKSNIPGSRITLKKISSTQWAAIEEQGFWENGT
jgi:hypothetical protein